MLRKTQYVYQLYSSFNHSLHNTVYIIHARNACMCLSCVDMFVLYKYLKKFGTKKHAIKLMNPDNSFFHLSCLRTNIPYWIFTRVPETYIRNLYRKILNNGSFHFETVLPNLAGIFRKFSTKMVVLHWATQHCISLFLNRQRITRNRKCHSSINQFLMMHFYNKIFEIHDL